MGYFQQLRLVCHCLICMQDHSNIDALHVALQPDSRLHCILNGIVASNTEVLSTYICVTRSGQDWYIQILCLPREYM